MDIQIKYKEVDIQKLGKIALEKAKDNCKPWGDLDAIGIEAIKVFGELCQEESKQVEHVLILNSNVYDGMFEEIEVSTNIATIKHVARIDHMREKPMNYFAQERKYNKEELGKYIDILNQIYNQME